MLLMIMLTLIGLYYLLSWCSDSDDDDYDPNLSPVLRQFYPPEFRFNTQPTGGTTYRVSALNSTKNSAIDSTIVSVDEWDDEPYIEDNDKVNLISTTRLDEVVVEFPSVDEAQYI